MRKLIAVALCCALWGCGGKKVTANGPQINEPDKDLYVRATHDLNRSRYIQSRLLLQTLINTYPDSEFLPQAKYALAESFYKEGTTSSLNQAEIEFKDYITFFPQNDLAADAQLKVALTHIRQMEKPDRDSTQARLAEVELKNMIRDYPDSNLLDEAKDKLRGVQEVLATGIFGIGRQYYIRRSYPAATGRFKEVWDKYPDYSHIDETLYLMAEALHRNNKDAESVSYYTAIVRDHPLSERVTDAKARLIELKQPIPEPNPVALARLQQQQQESRGMFGKMFGLFKSHPLVSSDTKAAAVEDGSKTDPSPDAGSGNFSVEPSVVKKP